MKRFLDHVQTELKEFKEFKEKYKKNRDMFTKQVTQLQEQIAQQDKNLSTQRKNLHDVEEHLDAEQKAYQREKINLVKQVRSDAQRYNHLLDQNEKLRDENDVLVQTNISLKNQLRHSSPPRAGEP